MCVQLIKTWPLTIAPWHSWVQVCKIQTYPSSFSYTWLNMNWNLQNLQNNDFFNIPIFQIPVSHDHVFGEYTCKATNKMGTLRRKVLLKEGAKPGIPALDYKTINTDSVEMTILVSTSIVVFDGMFSKDSRNLSQFFRSIQQSFIYES